MGTAELPLPWLPTADPDVHASVTTLSLTERALTPSTPLLTSPLPVAVLPLASGWELGLGVKGLATLGASGVQAPGVPGPLLVWIANLLMPLGRPLSTTVVTPDSLSGSVFISGATSMSEMLTSASAAGHAPAVVESERQPKVAVDSPESAMAKRGKENRNLLTLLFGLLIALARTRVNSLELVRLITCESAVTT